MRVGGGETSQGLIPGRFPKSPELWTAGSGRENPQHPLQPKPFTAGFSCPSWPSQIPGSLGSAELHLRVSRGRQALKALSPHQQGSRDKEGWVGGRGRELGHA